MAELADALGSGSSGRKAVRVRVPPSAPNKVLDINMLRMYTSIYAVRKSSSIPATLLLINTLWIWVESHIHLITRVGETATHEDFAPKHALAPGSNEEEISVYLNLDSTWTPLVFSLTKKYAGNTSSLFTPH